jgi:hypothetical protein
MATKAKRDKDTITLGSVIPYIMEYTGTVPAHTEICKPENRLGYSKGGAEIAYTEETYEERDDLGYVSKIITTTEEALVKLGLLTWNGDTLKYLADRCAVTEDKTKGTRTIHIGGAGNSQGKDWVLCLHHQDTTDGDLWVIIRGRNNTGLTLTLAADAGTVIEPEFKAMPQDEKGTLITIIEEIPTTA